VVKGITVRIKKQKKQREKGFTKGRGSSHLESAAGFAAGEDAQAKALDSVSSHKVSYAKIFGPGTGLPPGERAKGTKIVSICQWSFPRENPSSPAGFRLLFSVGTALDRRVVDLSNGHPRAISTGTKTPRMDDLVRTHVCRRS
jgi:hypothetical protein